MVSIHCSGPGLRNRSLNHGIPLDLSSHFLNTPSEGIPARSIEPFSSFLLCRLSASSDIILGEMFLFGHTGITLGVATLLSPVFTPASSLGRSWFLRLAAKLDIRVLLIGSMLPDIIDKPLGMVFLRESLNNGRIYAHTLLFLLLISVAGFILWRRSGRIWLGTLAFGSLFHLLLDEMWLSPRIILWPLFGSFPSVEAMDWFDVYYKMLFTEPKVYIPEIIGLAILVWFVISLIRHRSLGRWLRHGYLG